MTQREHKDIAVLFRDGICEAKAHLELILVRDMKATKKGYGKYGPAAG